MSDFKIAIDKSSEQKLYEQLYTQFAAAIENGDLAPGEKLPSIRTLSDDCDVGRNTVTKAYAKLEEAGYIGSQEKSGFYVTGKKGGAPAGGRTPPENKAPRAPSRPHRVRSPRAKPGASPLPADDGNASGETEKAVRRALFVPDPLGESFFREQVALFLKKYTSLNADKDCVVIEASRSNILLKVFLLDEITSPRPALRGLLRKAEYKQHEAPQRPLVALSQDFDFGPAHPFALDAKYIPINEASLEESGASVVFVSARRSYPRDIRQGILNWANRKPFRYITEFDISKNTGNFVYTGKKDAALAEKCIYFFDLADFAVLPAKVSAAVLPPLLCKSYRKRYNAFDCPLSTDTQSLLTLLLKGMLSK